VDEQVPEAFRIVVLETLDDEFDRRVFLILLAYMADIVAKERTMLDRENPVKSNTMV
jgi:hypothetical protein